MRITSPVGIDLGADHTGVVMYHNHDGKVSDCEAVLLTLDNAFTVQQVQRRQLRHLRRNIKRKKLARRLLYDIAVHYRRGFVRSHTESYAVRHPRFILCFVAEAPRLHVF